MVKPIIPRQKTPHTPRRRACSYDYQIRYVFEHQGNIAIGINYRQPGFEGPKQPKGNKPEYDDELGSWAAPFIMAAINTKNIHLSQWGHQLACNLLLHIPLGCWIELMRQVFQSLRHRNNQNAQCLTRNNKRFLVTRKGFGTMPPNPSQKPTPITHGNLELDCP